MQLKKLFKELDADLRNKLNYPRVLLASILQRGGKPKKYEIRRAIRGIDKASGLTNKWFKAYFSKRRGGKNGRQPKKEIR